MLSQDPQGGARCLQPCLEGQEQRKERGGGGVGSLEKELVVFPSCGQSSRDGWEVGDLDGAAGVGVVVCGPRDGDREVTETFLRVVL